MSANPYTSPEAVDTDEAVQPIVAHVRQIPFKTAIVLSACVGFAVGAVAGIAVFAISLFHDIDANLPDELGSHELRGVPLGVLALLVMPPYYALMAAILAIPAYWPFRLVLGVARRWIRMPVVVERVPS